MANLVVSFTLPSAKVDEYVAHYVYVHKNEETNEDGTPKYTDKQWVKEHIIRSVRHEVVRGRNAKYHADMASYNANDIQ